MSEEPVKFWERLTGASVDCIMREQEGVLQYIEGLERALRDIRDVAKTSEGTQWHAMIAEKALYGEDFDNPDA